MLKQVGSSCHTRRAAVEAGVVRSGKHLYVCPAAGLFGGSYQEPELSSD